MTNKQRAYLRTLGNSLDSVLHIGKEGITPTVSKQAWDVLETRELIKVTVQKGAPKDTRACCDELCALVHAQPVQCIGGKFLIYRPSRENKKIELPEG